jgi:hypothetical protein
VHAGAQLRVDLLALAVVLVARVEHPRRLAVQLARGVAVHLLQARVAAHDAPLAEKEDPGGRRREDRLLLAQQPRDLLAVATRLGDVVGDPHRAARRVGVADRLGDDAREERGAVLAPHLPVDVELLARREHRHRDAAERLVALARGIDDLAGLADQLLGPPAEQLGELRIAQEELAVAREGDADPGVGEHRLVLELREARAPGVARRRLLEGDLRRRAVVHRASASTWKPRA